MISSLLKWLHAGSRHDSYKKTCLTIVHCDMHNVDYAIQPQCCVSSLEYALSICLMTHIWCTEVCRYDLRIPNVSNDVQNSEGYA